MDENTKQTKDGELLVSTEYDMFKRRSRTSGSIRVKENKMDAVGVFKCGFFTSFTGHVKTRGNVYIGSYCAVGDDCRMIGTSHNINLPNLQIRLQAKIGSTKRSVSKGPIRVGHNVWMGDNVTILSGVTVGNGAVLATGSVVTSDVEPFSVHGGVPAKFIKWRFSESVRNQLQELSWWAWSPDRIEKNKKFFDLEIPQDEDLDIEPFIQY